MVNEIMERSFSAFQKYRKTSGEIKAQLLETIASEIENLGDSLIKIIHTETNLPEARIMGERGRTCGQLRLFAGVARSGSHLGIRKDEALPDRAPLPRPDLRKMYIPLGPIVVFGASNFPLAYSTAGGDTASALATGCTVVLKAHPAHPQTSALVAGAISTALRITGLDPDIFIHVDNPDFQTGKDLVQHPRTAGVGFTGSVSGGKALAAYAQERKNPIPVFTEMGSTNPVVFLGGFQKEQIQAHSQNLAGAITLGAGQFCTNPGLIFGVKSQEFSDYFTQVGGRITEIQGAKMLHSGIYNNYLSKMNEALAQKGVTLVSQSNSSDGDMVAIPSLAKTSGDVFLNNHQLHEEVFGPYSLVVEFENYYDLKTAMESMDGQLTCSLIASEEVLSRHTDLIDVAEQRAGRIIFNGVPTGVEVCDSMVHGGPSPSTSDSRFTAVGSDAVLRWLRPVSYQNFPVTLLPAELK